MPKCFLTQEALEKLKEELKYLKEVNGKKKEHFDGKTGEEIEFEVNGKKNKVKIIKFSE